MIHASTRGARHGWLRHALANQLPFRTSGALKGDAGQPATWGQLYGDDLERIKADRGRIRYHVMSYATPIAWVTDDGTVYRVKGKFSMTTSHHMGHLYALEMGTTGPRTYDHA